MEYDLGEQSRESWLAGKAPGCRSAGAGDIGSPAGDVGDRFQHGCRSDFRDPSPGDRGVHGGTGEIARDWSSRGIVTTGPDGLGRNEAVLFGPDGLEESRYTKMHPFSYGCECQYYAPGSEVILFEWQGLRVAPLICYDLRFPEVFRSAIRLGAEVLCVLANWPAAREDHWITLLKARAIENQAYVIGVNRCGDDPALHYGGRSLIYGPRGEVLADGGSGEGAVQVRLDKELLTHYRQEFPMLADIHSHYGL